MRRFSIDLDKVAHDLHDGTCWKRVFENNPHILKATNIVDGMIDQLEGVPREKREDLTAAICDEARAVSITAILYGMKLGRAITAAMDSLGQSGGAKHEQAFR